MQLARDDAQVGTSLLESRLLFGQYRSLRSLQRDDEIARSSGVARRWPRSSSPSGARSGWNIGETVYLLEPNVKRSRGGLRDIHLLRWLWYLKSGVADPDRLHDMGMMSKFDHRRLMSAQNFLLRVRNEMHFHANETCDALSRAEQLRLAEAFQYQGRRECGRSSSSCATIFTTRRTCGGWRIGLSELMQPASRVSRVLEPMFGRKTEDDYQIGRHEISATPRATARLAQHREEVLKLVELARREGKRISQDTWHFVYRTAPQYSSEPKPAVMSKFLEMLADPLRLGELLRRLHELGVLEKIIPAFLSRAEPAAVQPVSQVHGRRALHSRGGGGDAVCRAAGYSRATCTEGWRTKRLLHLALLLHDLGKGYEEDHSEVGRRIAEETAQRFSLPPDETETLEFLVHGICHVASGVEVRHVAGAAGEPVRAGSRYPGAVGYVVPRDVRRPGGGRAGCAQQVGRSRCCRSCMCERRATWRRRGVQSTDVERDGERRQTWEC